MTVWTVTEEVEVGSENGETYWILGVYDNEQKAKLACKDWWAETCPATENTVEGKPRKHQHYRDEPAGFWCKLCQHGVGFENHEVN